MESEMYEDYDDYDDYHKNLHASKDFVMSGECNCDWCVAGREKLMAGEDVDFIDGVMEEEQIQHKINTEKEKALDDKISLAMRFLESQGCSTVIAANQDYKRIEIDACKDVQVARIRAITAVYDFITTQFSKKRK